MRPQSIVLLNGYGEEERLSILRFYADNDGEPVIAVKWTSGKIQNLRIVDLIKTLSNDIDRLNSQKTFLRHKIDNLLISQSEWGKHIAEWLHQYLTSGPYIEHETLSLSDHLKKIECRREFLLQTKFDLNQLREKFKARIFDYDEVLPASRVIWVTREEAKIECYEICVRENKRPAEVARGYIGPHRIKGFPSYSPRQLANSIAQYGRKLRMKEDEPKPKLTIKKNKR